jgi:hypothetical protein
MAPTYPSQLSEKGPFPGRETYMEDPTALASKGHPKALLWPAGALPAVNPTLKGEDGEPKGAQYWGISDHSRVLDYTLFPEVPRLEEVTSGPVLRAFLEGLNQKLIASTSQVRFILKPITCATAKSLQLEFERIQGVQHHMPIYTATSSSNTCASGTIYLLESSDNIVWEQSQYRKDKTLGLEMAKEEQDLVEVARLEQLLKDGEEDHRDRQRMWHTFCAIFIYNNVCMCSCGCSWGS